MLSVLLLLALLLLFKRGKRVARKLAPKTELVPEVVVKVAKEDEYSNECDFEKPSESDYYDLRKEPSINTQTKLT